jgi:PadR family transcriptional regulator, regulatory protein AphA
MSNTDFVILGMLSLEPMSGYQIKQEIKQSIGAFWQESDGQIYPALKRLLVSEQIQRHDTEKAEARNKKIYEITPSGIERLQAWLTQPVAKDTVRNEFCLKLFFAGNSNPETTIDMIQGQRRALMHSRQMMQNAHAEIEELTEKHYQPHIPYWQATTKYGEAIVNAKIQWCDEVLATLLKPKQKH